MRPSYFPPHKDILEALSISKDDLFSEHDIPVPAPFLRHLITCALAAVEVDRDSYLERYPDIAQAVEDGSIADPVGHYLNSGYFEGRVALPKAFDEQWYLESFRDTRLKIENGEVESAKDHYLTNGYIEQRAYSEQSRHEIAAWWEVMEGVA